MAIEYKVGTRATCVNSDIISDSLGKSGDGAVNGASVESVHSQSSAGSISGLDLYQTTGGGGWGMRFNSGHAIVGSKLKKFKVWTRINNPSNRSDQDMTCKVYDGTDKTTVRASSNSINTSVLDQGSTFEDVEFTFSSPVVINAGDVVVVSCPSDLGTAGSWNCEIKESADTNGHFVTWIDNGSFTLQTSRCLKYDATLPVESKVGSSAYTFDGSNDFVEVSGQTRFTEINNPNQISTIVFWYKSSSSPSSTYDKIMGTVDQSASDRGFNIMRYQGSGKGMISLTQAGGNNGLNDFTTTTGLFPVDGNWYHYAFKFDDVAGKLSIYKDGSLFEEEDYASWTPATGGNTQRPFQIGKDTSNSKWFNGQIDDCAIYYRGLTATEIEKLVNNNSPSPNITNSPAYTQVGSTVVASGTTIEATNCQSNQNPVHRVYKDIGSVSDSTFYFEFDYKQKQNTNNLFPIALQSGTGKTNIASEDMIYLKTDGLNMTIAKKNGGSNTNSSDGWITIVANTQYYCSITRSSNTASLKVYTDSGRSSNQVGGTKTVSVSDVSGLQYIHSESRGDGGGGTNIGWVLDNISLTNGATTKATEGDPQLVSSLSNKTGLKAHYSMDSVGGTEYGSLVLNDVMHWEASQNSYTEQHPVIFGNKITSGNPLIGKTINHVGFQLYRGQGTTTDTITFAVWDGTSTSTTPRYTFGSMDISDIVTSGSLGSSSPCQLYVIGSSDSGVTIQENDVLGAVHNRESGSYTTPNSVEMGQEDANATYQNGHRAINMRNTSSARAWTEATNKSPYFTTSNHCKNDASSTSELAGMTNLPANTIFEQTDDTPTYWWKQSDNTWKLDGKTNIEPSLTDASVWSMVGNQGSATTSLTGGKLRINQATNSGNASDSGCVAVFDTGSATDKFVMRFNFTTGSSHTDGGGNAVCYWGFSSNNSHSSTQGFVTGQSGNSADCVAFRWHIQSDKTRVGSWDNGSLTWGTDPNESLTFANSTTYYWELSYDGTSAVLKRFTNDTYTSPAHTGTYTLAGRTGMRYFVMGSTYDTQAGVFIIDHNKIEIQKGRSTWLE